MLGLPRNLHNRTEGWQDNILHIVTVKIVYLHLVMSIVHECHHKLVVDHSHKRYHVFLLGNEFLPVRSIWMLKIDGNDTATRSIQVGLDIEDGAVVANKVIAGIGCVQQANEWAITIHFAVVEAVLRVGTLPDVHDHVMSTVSGCK